MRISTKKNWTSSRDCFKKCGLLPEKWRDNQQTQIKPERTTLQKQHAPTPTVEGIGKRTPHNDAGHDRK